MVNSISFNDGRSGSLRCSGGEDRILAEVAWLLLAVLTLFRLRKAHASTVTNIRHIYRFRSVAPLSVHDVDGIDTAIVDILAAAMIKNCTGP